jgi:hypothetical protein
MNVWTFMCSGRRSSVPLSASSGAPAFPMHRFYHVGLLQSPAMPKKAKPKKPPTKAPSKPGPAPELFKIEGMSWQDAIKKSLTKEKPPGGWPKMGRGE